MASTGAISSSWGHRFAAGYVSFIQRFAKTVLCFCLGSAALALVYCVTHLQFKTSRDDLVSQSSTYVQAWKRYTQEFGGENDIIVAVAGKDRSAIITSLEAIAGEISKHPKLFSKLCYKLDVESVKRKGLQHVDVARLSRIQTGLSQLESLVGGSVSQLTLARVMEPGLLSQAAVASGERLNPQLRSAALHTLGQVDSLRSYLESAGEFASPWKDAELESQTGGLELPEYFFNDAGDVAFLRVVPTESSDDFVRGGEPIQILRDTIARLKTIHAGLDFGLTGLPVLETDEMEAARVGSQWSALVSTVGIIAVFVTAFRAWRHPLFVVVSLATAACWTLGWTALTIGHLNILSVSFIVTLIGLGIDYGILWLSRFEAMLGEGMTPQDANIDTARSIGIGTVVGAMTTAFAFFSTMISGFLGLRELGWIAGSGILFCLIAMMTLLPALLALGARRSLTMRRSNNDLRPTFPLLNRFPRLTIATLGLFLACSAWGLHRLGFDYNLLHLQAKGLESVEWEHRLLEETGTSGWYALTLANSAEEARRLAREIKTLPTVGQVVELASFIPRDQALKMPIIESIHESLARMTAGESLVAPAQTTPEELSRMLAEMSGASQSDAEEIRQLSTVARRAWQQWDRLSPEDQSVALDDYERRLRKDLLQRLNRLGAVSSPDPITVRDLPPSLVERFYSASGKWGIQIFAKSSAWDYGPLAEFRKELESVDPQITGRPISTLHSLEQMFDGFFESSLLAGVIIFLCVWIDLRRLTDALLAILPLVGGCVSMFGIMGWLNVDLNPANLITLPLIIGIGVDYGVHVVHDYRHQQGRYFLGWTFGRSLILNSLTTIISFATLALAPHWGMISIGVSLAIGVICCSLHALVLLPAILSLLTYHRDRHVSEEVEAPLVITPNVSDVIRVRRVA